MLFKKEHYDLLSNFENQFKHRRLDKEKKDMWHAGVIYQDGHVNELFLAFRRGYAFGVYQSSDAANELAATPAAPSQGPVTLTDEYVVSHLEAAGVKFQRFKGGISGKKDCWSTSGSQAVHKLANGVRAVIAALREKEGK